MRSLDTRRPLPEARRGDPAEKDRPDLSPDRRADRLESHRCIRHLQAIRHDGDRLVAGRDRGRRIGAVRKLQLPQEALLRQLICNHTPDQLGMPYPLWTRPAVIRLIDARLGLRLKVRTLGSYLVRWGFSPHGAGRHARDLSSARRLSLRKEYPRVAARAITEDAEVNWGDDIPLVGHADGAACIGPAATAAGSPLGLTSAVNGKGQARWKTHVGVHTASDLIDFLRRLVKVSAKKVFLVLRGTRATGTGGAGVACRACRRDRGVLPAHGRCAARRHPGRARGC